METTQPFAPTAVHKIYPLIFSLTDAHMAFDGVQTSGTHPHHVQRSSTEVSTFPPPAFPCNGKDKDSLAYDGHDVQTLARDVIRFPRLILWEVWLLGEEKGRRGAHFYDFRPATL